MRFITPIHESEAGNQEPIEDILKEKGLYFNYDQSQVEEQLKEKGFEHLIGKVGTIITMVDPDEGETSLWVMETSTPGLSDIAKRIR